MTDSIMLADQDAYVNESFPGTNFGGAKQLKLDGTGGSEKRAFISFPLPFGSGEDATLAEATGDFVLTTAWAGTITITARRLVEDWDQGEIDWDHQPSDSGTDFTQVVVDGAIGDSLELDLTALVQEMLDDGDDWFGIALLVDSSDVVALASRDTITPGYVPRIALAWSDKPDPPEDLVPSGNRVVSKALPTLGWIFPDQAQARVQVADAFPPIDNIVFDSTLVAMLETSLDLSTTICPAFSDGDRGWWRVRAENDVGRLSEWSHWQSFTRHEKSTLTLASPTEDAVVEDVTPNVLATFSGTLDSYAWYLDEHVELESGDLVWSELAREPRRQATSIDFTLPIGLLRRRDRTYRLRVRGWDEFERQHTPGDPTWVQDLVHFTFDRSSEPAPFESLSVSNVTIDGPDVGPMSSPLMRVVGSISVAPDFICLVVNGERVKGYTRLDPSELLNDDGDYQIDFWGAPPYRTLEYELEAVNLISGRLKHSQDNPTVDARSEPTGKWLVDPDDPDFQIPMRGTEDPDFEWGEMAQTYLTTSGRVSRLIQSTRGYEGTITGELHAMDGHAARRFLRRFQSAWQRGRVLRLIMSELNIPVVIGEPRPRTLNRPRTVVYAISFQAWQVDEYDVPLTVEV